jgi:ABC-type phosphate/phosphonate transport system ATPase subunit
MRSSIELLGVGVPGGGGRWLLHRVCARVEGGALTAVVARAPAESSTLLDALTGQLIPREGRVWVDHRPLMRETAGRIRALVADVGRTTPFALQRSALWNTLVTPGHHLAGLLRFPRRSERDAALRALEAVGLAGLARRPLSALTLAERLRVALARALSWQVTAIVLRDVDTVLDADDAAALLGVARRLAHAHRIIAIASLASTELAREHADRVILLADGLLVFDGRAPELTDSQVRRRLGAALP